MVSMDRHLLERAGRGLICALVCPIRVGVESYICQAEHCQEENEVVAEQPMKKEVEEVDWKYQ